MFTLTLEQKPRVKFCNMKQNFEKQICSLKLENDFEM